MIVYLRWFREVMRISSPKLVKHLYSGLISKMMKKISRRKMMTRTMKMTILKPRRKKKKMKRMKMRKRERKKMMTTMKKNQALRYSTQMTAL